MNTWHSWENVIQIGRRKFCFHTFELGTLAWRFVACHKVIQTVRICTVVHRLTHASRMPKPRRGTNALSFVITTAAYPASWYRSWHGHLIALLSNSDWAVTYFLPLKGLLAHIQPILLKYFNAVLYCSFYWAFLQVMGHFTVGHSYIYSYSPLIDDSIHRHSHDMFKIRKRSSCSINRRLRIGDVYRLSHFGQPFW
jgi:hypothetical protein